MDVAKTTKIFNTKEDGLILFHPWTTYKWIESYKHYQNYHNFVYINCYKGGRCKCIVLATSNKTLCMTFAMPKPNISN